MKEVFGKDGIRVNDSYGEMWIAWDANQIKQTDNLNPSSNPDIRYSQRNTAPTFYSHMGKVVVKNKKLAKSGAS